MNQSKNPIWKKSMLSKLNFVEICEWLDEIAQNGDPFGYETDRTGHYNDYKELFDDLSDSACHLRDALREQEVEKNWDDRPNRTDKTSPFMPSPNVSSCSSTLSSVISTFCRSL